MKKIYTLFLIPLLVGLIVVFIEFGLPYLFKEKKELSYKIIDPITYLSPEKTGVLDIKINDVRSKYLVANQYFIENSGQIPLKGITLRINFINYDTIFQIYNASYETIPKYEFGKITTDLEKNCVRFKYELLNPGDKVYINILTNLQKPSEVFSKSEGMILKQSTAEEKTSNKTSLFLSLFISVLSTGLAFFITKRGLSSYKDIKTIINDLFAAKQIKSLTIISALYGKNEKYIDVTEKLNQKISDGRLSIIVSNEIAGDPIVGIKKDLKVVYSLGSQIQTLIVEENDVLELPSENK